jgi:putative restriction endonuclease
MKLYVGITDRDWFRFLRARRAIEMNFWRPRSTNDFGAIQPGELFLFKTRFPENKIVGGAFLVRHTTLPLDLAWSTFAEANGVSSLADFRAKISSIRGDLEKNPTIGCTILTQPFYLEEHSFFDPPSDWASNIVTGKSYDATTGEGLRLFEQAKSAMVSPSATVFADSGYLAEDSARYGEPRFMKPRLGQGGFRVLVLDEYARRCSITGERTLPVLEAAHIRPYADDGPHDVSNGILLRSDLHTLFDKGYITMTNDLRVEVSRRIREEFSNGREYYALHGRELKVLPSDRSHRPAAQFLEWHQNNCFLGS